MCVPNTWNWLNSRGHRRVKISPLQLGGRLSLATQPGSPEAQTVYPGDLVEICQEVVWGGYFPKPLESKRQILQREQWILRANISEALIMYQALSALYILIHLIFTVTQRSGCHCYPPVYIWESEAQNNLPKLMRLDVGRAMTWIRKPGPWARAPADLLRETACSPQSKLMQSDGHRMRVGTEFKKCVSTSKLE